MRTGCSRLTPEGQRGAGREEQGEEHRGRERRVLCETGRHTQTQRTRSEGEPTGLVVKKLSVSTELAEAKLVGHWLLLHMQRERESVCVRECVCG